MKTTHLSLTRSTDKQNVVCPSTEHYPASKMNEILMHAATGMNPENMLTEIGQTQKDKNCMRPLLWGTRDRKVLKTDSRMEVTGIWEEEGVGSYCLIGTAGFLFFVFCFRRMKEFWKELLVMGAQHCLGTCCYWITELRVQKWSRWSIICSVYFMAIRRRKKMPNVFHSFRHFLTAPANKDNNKF